jgi:spermidine synthase
MTNKFRTGADSTNATIVGLFFLSGATSLAYQTIWFRRFATMFGSSTLAMAAVVVAFLVGLAAGAYLAGRLTRRVAEPLKWYGYLEISIGVYALLIPFLVSWLTGYSAGIFGDFSNNSLVLFGGRAIIAFLIIGLPCLCMGGTLPILIEFCVKGVDSVGNTTGLLYGINTLGATVGCYLTGFHLLPTWGSSVTNFAMAACNVAIGIVALYLARTLRGKNSTTVSAALNSGIAERSKESANQRLTSVLIASMLTGFAALLLEMVWSRQLAIILGGSTYTFTATLCVVLLGIGIGGLLYRHIERLIEVNDHLLDVIVFTIVTTCITTVVAQLLIPKLCLLGGALRPFRDSDLGNGIVCLTTAIILELLPAIGMGVLFPALAQTAKRAGTTAGDVVGMLYLWNTMGAAFGAVLSFSLLVPLVGSSGAVTVAVGAYVAATVLLEINANKLSLPRLSFKLILGMTSAIILARYHSPLPSNMGMYLYGTDKSPGAHADVLYFKEGRSCNVLVTKSPDGDRSLRVNGKVDASTGSDQAMQLGCAYLTRFLRPNAKSVCVIGFGSGTTAGASLLFPNTSVTCFELEPAVYEGARFFASINHSPWESDRFEIVLDDARGAINRLGITFDLIISEPSNPWIAGVSNLYALEFYEIAKQRLSQKGLLAQWVQTYNFTLNEFRLILRTLQRVFPHVALIRINDSDTMLIASTEELCPSAKDLEVGQRFVEAVPEIRKDLDGYFGSSDVRSLLLRHFVLDEAGLKRFQLGDDGRAINTDINMRLEFEAPRQLFRQQSGYHKDVALAIRRSINVEWYEACVDRWKCTEQQATALADLLERFISTGDEQEVQRMISLCRRIAPAEPFFQVVERIKIAHANTQDVSNEIKPISEEVFHRIERVGVSLWRRKQYESAVKAFSELVSLVPQSATSWMNLAVNYEALNQKELAAEAASKALSIDPLNSFVQKEGKRIIKADSRSKYVESGSAR